MPRHNRKNPQDSTQAVLPGTASLNLLSTIAVNPTISTPHPHQEEQQQFGRQLTYGNPSQTGSYSISRAAPNGAKH
jgi:hypothetical protein